MLNFLTRKAVTFETRPFLGQRVRATGITKNTSVRRGEAGEAEKQQVTVVPEAFRLGSEEA